jgi:ribosome maturation factor RimP
LEVGLAPTFFFQHMINQEATLVVMLQPIVNAMGYDLWGIERSGGARGSLLRIYIDNVTGITLNDCERVSDQVAGILDVKDSIHGPYTLEVSSPGLDRPLFTKEHFDRYKEHTVRVRLQGKLHGRTNVVGKLTAVTDESVSIKDQDETFIIPLQMIGKANLVHQTSRSEAR